MADPKFVIFLKLRTTLSVAKIAMHDIHLQKMPKTIQIQFTACLWGPAACM